MKYLEWNNIISAYFFNPVNAGKDIHLYLTKNDIIGLGKPYWADGILIPNLHRALSDIAQSASHLALYRFGGFHRLLCSAAIADFSYQAVLRNAFRSYLRYGSRMRTILKKIQLLILITSKIIYTPARIPTLHFIL